MTMVRETERLNQITFPLLAWYDANRRALPWREKVSPYRTWVSEIMLQQTRVQAVLPYFQRFMEAAPDAAALAALPEQRLMALWQGLGYYSRARNLQRAAVVLAEQYGGALPCTYEELRALPGIGDYTAGAILSIAYGQAVPAVDGNVLRVTARITGDEGDITSPAMKKKITAALAEIIPVDAPGAFNQAMMELYRTEKINPVGGCLPIMLQIPVFLALYWVLQGSVELRGAPWVLWVHDLAMPDPWFVLPAIMAVTMFLQILLNPKPTDPTQARMMYIMPIVFSVMFFVFASGLVLYWLTNNVLSILQQWWINKTIAAERAKRLQS